MARRRREPPAAAAPADPSRAKPAAVPAAREPAPPGAIEGISPRDELVALAIATGGTLADAARASGAGRRTVYDIVRRPHVVARIQQIRREMLAEAMSKLASLAGRAVDTIAEVMEDRAVTPHTRVWAATVILEKTLALAGHVAVTEEMADVRRQLAALNPPE